MAEQKEKLKEAVQKQRKFRAALKEKAKELEEKKEDKKE